MQKQRIRGFLALCIGLRYINPRFTCLLCYLGLLNQAAKKYDEFFSTSISLRKLPYYNAMSSPATDQKICAKSSSSCCCCCIGVARNWCWGTDKRSKRRMRRGGEYGEGCPSFQPTTGSGERRKLPQRGSGRNPGRKRVLEYLELEKTLLIVTDLSYLNFLRHYI